MSSTEMASHLGVKGVKNVFFESFEKENQLAEEFQRTSSWK